MCPKLDHISEDNTRLLIYKDCLVFYISILPVSNIDDLFGLVVELNVILLFSGIPKSTRGNFFDKTFLAAIPHFLDLILDHKSMIVIFDIF